MINKTGNFTAEQFNNLDSKENVKTPKFVFKYKPKGHSDIFRPSERWLRS
jgi:hypothetical protein